MSGDKRGGGFRRFAAYAGCMAAGYLALGGISSPAPVWQLAVSATAWGVFGGLLLMAAGRLLRALRRQPKHDPSPADGPPVVIIVPPAGGQDGAETRVYRVGASGRS